MFQFPLIVPRYSQGRQIITYENSRYPYLKYYRVLWKYKMSVVTSKDINSLEDITSEKFNPLQDRNEIIQNLVNENNELRKYNLTLKETIRLLKLQMDDFIEKVDINYR